MPDRHALLGPSSAGMWMACPPSARLGEGMADKDSAYAQEGTLAHRIGELLLRKRWEGADITAELEQAQADPLYSGAMGEHMEAYAAFIEERMAEAATRCKDPRLFIEHEVHFEYYVPEGFGTSDAIIFSDGLLDVTDLKYGTGVPVSAENNVQMRIYGLGAYLAMSWAYDISTIRMTIFLVDDSAAGDYDYKSSISSGTYDKIKLSYENKDTGKREIYIAQDGANINQWGVLQYYEKIDSTGNAKSMADALLGLYNTKTRTLQLKNVLGDLRVRGGTLLVVTLGLGDINLSSYLMVEQVKHTFNNEQHLMDMKMRGGTFVA